MRKGILRINGRLQLILLLASVIPTVYALMTEEQEYLVWPLFFRSLLIVFPVTVADIAVRKCKSLLTYLLINAAVIAGMGKASWEIGSRLGNEEVLWVYVILLLFETFGLIRWRLSERLQQQKQYAAYLQEREEVTYTEFIRERQTFFHMTNPYLLLCFPGVYIVGILFANPPLCDLAMAETVCYAVLLVITVYLDKTEEYLSIHKKLRNVPRSRIYGIGRGMLCIFLLLLAVGMLPGIFLSGRRSYMNVRAGDIELADEEDMRRDGRVYEDGKKRSGNFRAVYREPPAWLNGVFYVIAAGVGCGVIVAAYRVIHGMFVDFRKAYDENGDLVEDVGREIDDLSESLPERRRKRRGNNNGQDVRTRYRRTINKHRKDMPGPGETPTEIEWKAGLAEDEAMQVLHKEYEAERYGK